MATANASTGAGDRDEGDAGDHEQVGDGSGRRPDGKEFVAIPSPALTPSVTENAVPGMAAAM